MSRFSTSPRIALSLVLGAVLASAAGPVRASREAVAETPGVLRFELVPADHARELPPELRAQAGAISPAEALGLAEAAGSHKVQLHWVVREHGDLSGYRVTLVAADGLPGNLAARWFVEPTAGVPVGEGLTAYSTELSLALDEPAPVAAAVEAVDLAGHAVLLGVRRSIAEAEPPPSAALSASAQAPSAGPIVLQTGRFAPTVSAAESSPSSYPERETARLAAPPTTLPANLEPGGAVSPRGPPTETVTT